jgi:2-methylcitrate dehydratase PrpD
LQHLVAVMLIEKTVSFHAAHDKPRMQDAAVLKQRAKVNLVRDEELAKLLPARETVVEVDLTDGTHLSERISAVRGTPRNPMTRNEVIDKARDLMTPVLGRDNTARLTDTIFDIEKVGEVRALRRLLQRG